MYGLVAFRAADEIKEQVHAGSNRSSVAWIEFLLVNMCTKVNIALWKVSLYNHGVNMLSYY